MSVDLSDMQAKKLPRCTFADVFADTSTDDVRAQLEPYMQGFVLPPTGRECICCGRPLLGMVGSFQWGLAHGEGQCGACGYPSRMYHRFPKGSPVEFFQLLLQYHPDDLVEEVQS